MNWRRVGAVVRRNLYSLRSTKTRWFDTFWWTTLDVLLYGSLGRFLAKGQVGLDATYFLSGVILFQFIYQNQIGIATGFLDETWSRNIINMMVTPLREREYLMGLVICSLIRASIGLAWVIATGWILYAFDISRLGLSFIPLAAELVFISWALAWFVIALVLRYGNSVEGFAWGIDFVLMPVSGLFFPIAALPGVFRAIAPYFPTTQIFEASRLVLLGKPMPIHDLVIGAAGTAALLIVSLVWLKFSMERFRMRGLVTRYS